MAISVRRALAAPPRDVRGPDPLCPLQGDSGRPVAANTCHLLRAVMRRAGLGALFRHLLNSLISRLTTQGLLTGGLRCRGMFSIRSSGAALY